MDKTQNTLARSKGLIGVNDFVKEATRESASRTTS